MKTNLCVFALSAVLCLCAAPALGVTFNSVTQFSATQNPNGPWSYKSVQIGALPSTATLMTFPDTCCGGHNWATTFPNDSFNNIGPQGVMHPGNGTDALVSFTNPFALAVVFSVSVSSVDADSNTSSDGKTLSMWRGNTQLDSQFLPGNYSGTISWNNSVTLQSGESFYLRLNRFSNNLNFADSQFETLTITGVPEPSSFVLLGLGVVCVVGRVFRTRYLA